MQTLKTRLYQIAIASTHITKPTAFYLESEVLDPHLETQNQTDVLFKIPQYRLTESMNVFVCAES